MKTFYIKTLGCKVNRYESDGIATELTDNGYKKAKTIKDAKVCIINTCTVTSKAGMQSRQAIRKISKSNPDAKIIVTGCHAQIEPELIKSIKDVDEIVDHKSKFQLTNAIMDSFPFPESNRCRDTVFRSFKNVVKGEMTRVYLKIQDGCNSYCSYCIIPYARGSSRSMPENEVIANLNQLYANGHNEAILTGIHIGVWGLDFSKKSTFSKLLKNIIKEKAVPRVRISSIEPNELTDDIIELAADNTRLCDHFHIPLQSGDNEILKKMERPYNKDIFICLIKKINKKLPLASIGIDVIAGFPGESKEQFENTYSLIQDLQISYLHVFPFSPRKGTKAYDFPDKVNNNEIKSRCSLLRKLSISKKTEFENRMINITLKAIIQTKRDKKTNLLKATTSNYLSVLVEGEDNLKGKIVDIIPEKRDENKKLHGIIK
ncbi:MAG: tRNA (N(6)-L-threonylcarbamoyladenosine(37)-C(2))-methylthiotransferase MtaB [Desulfobacteraceae bacterium]|nr:tRNA (N(6)-L-threonylcarbamoyladenosine(37)-C(2))-methylthiotransferase MtaB [Desulfobacteraceae bacterium]